MKKLLSKMLNFIFKFFRIKSNRIVFETGNCLINGNVYAVYNYIKTNKINNFETIWLVDRNTDVSMLHENDYVYYKTLKSYFCLATAHYWIRNQSLGSLIKKKKGQIYIQLWHGNAIKCMGYDVNNDKVRSELDHVKEWDYFIANNEWEAKNIKSSTGYKGKVEVLGMATIDTVFSLASRKNFKEKVFRKINVPKKLQDKKIILYAPTFRDFELKNNIIDVPIKKLGNLKEYIILVRLHPLVRKKINPNLFNNINIINACDYPDASELLSISDILITDYSSIFIDYSPLNKPIIFYPYDYEKYLELRGGFYLDYKKDLPGPICYNEEELFEMVLNINKSYKEFKDKQIKFNQKYNYYADGNAAKRLVEKLINKEFDKGR